ncbi:hypothetical protein KKB43_01700 [Patescibacteria group bacterium]|nr:hypothetical protein [Patescibacteria group bacterium]MBU4579708.1 hypothetical protein [Patescibacteria group bacterium]
MYFDKSYLGIPEISGSLFDNKGLVVPPAGFQSEVTGEHNDFSLCQFEINAWEPLKRIQEVLPAYNVLSLMEFQDRCGHIKEKALKHPLIGHSAFRRCHLLLPIPHIPELADSKQLGRIIITLLNAAKRAYENEFSSRKFLNHHASALNGEMHVNFGMRYKKLLTQIAQAPQAGILLPNSLQGYSIQADRAIISFFPDFIFLVGIEHILAIIAFPDKLACGEDTPGLDMAALSGESVDSSFFFWADGYGIDFVCTQKLKEASSVCSGGLLIL